MNGDKSNHLSSCINWSLVGLALSLFIPSIGLLQNYFGVLGVAVYIAIASLILLIGYKFVFARFVSIVTDKQLLWLTGATFVLLLTFFIVVYPLANSGVFGGGSDRDEALNIATTEMLRGHFPYYIATYLGNPISPLPGSLVLAVPFLLLGNSAYQNLFWFFTFLITLNSYLRDRRLALLLFGVIIILSPIIIQEYVTGGDLLANSLFVFLFVMWMFDVIPHDGVNVWKKSLLAVLLGVGLASRAHFILLLPLVFSALVQSTGWKSASKYIAITCLTLGLLTIPFYLYDPQGFSPLHTSGFLGQFQTILPFSGIIVPSASGIIALLLSTDKKNGFLPILLRNCAIVLAFPVLSGIILQSIMVGKPDFEFSSYGLSFLFFGTVAFSQTLFGSKKK